MLKLLGRLQARKGAKVSRSPLSPIKAIHNLQQEVAFYKKKADTDDHLYLIRQARKRDKSGLQKELKRAQIRADQEKAVENLQKEERRDERRHTRAAILLETSKSLVLGDNDIARLNNDELNRQLDCHRNIETKLSIPVNSDKIPLKSHMKLKSERVAELKKAVARYLARTEGHSSSLASSGPDTNHHLTGLPDEDSLYQSDHNDDMV